MAARYATTATLCFWVFIFLSICVSLKAVEIPTKPIEDEAAKQWKAAKEAAERAFDHAADISGASKILAARSGVAALFPAVISAAASLVVLYCS
ncbi:unnamed protein product [Spirodela intermedia]|uniref:Uncharacterized protein n=1 Tax=Spirodela intermedia TaxID=51605 RepID=A0A7I8L4V0_SPIIN|nr:unnamed protein product [Spirodela intermedia]